MAKNLILLFALLFSASFLSAQSAAPTTEEETVLTEVETPASFPGGQDALVKYFTDNMRYPADAKTEGVEGKVVLKFIVEKDGKISKIKIIDEVDARLMEESVRLLRKMPKWTPGKQGTENVRMWMTLPINFKL